MRNQFNVEHSKVKSALKSVTGTDDVYTPSLQWYVKLLFLESCKNRTSFGSEVPLSDVPLSQGATTHVIECRSEDANCYENIEYLDNVFSPEICEINESQENVDDTFLAEQVLGSESASLNEPRYTSPSPQSSRPSSSSSITTNNQQEGVVFPCPSTSTRSTSSTFGICSTTRRKKKNSQLNSSDEFSHVMKSLISSMKEPISISMPQTNSTTDPVDRFLMFIGSLLRGFKDEELKLEVMMQITQLTIDAKTTDCQPSKKSRTDQKIKEEVI